MYINNVYVVTGMYKVQDSPAPRGAPPKSPPRPTDKLIMIKKHAYIYIYIYIYKLICTYMYTCIHAYVHTYIHTYKIR